MSILNVMLMSTVERRQEIGVLGAVLALFAGLVLNQIVLGDPTVTFRLRDLSSLALAVVSGLIASLLSGLYPVRKAANERPVDALRK